MRRILLMSMMLALLAMPVMATADDQTIPPEANWTPTPPAEQTVDTGRLASLLVEKGMITRQEYAQLPHPQSSSPSPQGNGGGWTWGEIDAYQRSPINSATQGD
jgi:hypothetical protein